MTLENHKYKYLFGSRMLTHTLFWMGYYLCFSFLWAKDGQLYQSFGLELILMPLRIGASYLTIYWLIPNLLLENQPKRFLLFYLVMMIFGGIIQRILTFYFHELFFVQTFTPLWNINSVIRSMVLINSTVLFLSAIKMYDYWRIEKSKADKNHEIHMIIRSDKRNFKVLPSEILYIEGLGNYVTFYIQHKKPIISYLKLKELEKVLPNQFIRAHKSFIVNRDKIESYSSENVEINERLIPVGKSFNLKNLNMD